MCAISTTACRALVEQAIEENLWISGDLFGGAEIRHTLCPQIGRSFCGSSSQVMLLQNPIAPQATMTEGIGDIEVA